jgi:hypothetical protein
VDKQDQWVEVWNSETRAVDISGWSIDAGADRSTAYRFPANTVLPAGGFLVLFRQQSGLSLDDGGGTVRLLGPTGALLDSVAYVQLSPDASYSRDTAGTWHVGWPPSPGQPNAAAKVAAPRRVMPIRR